MLLNKNKKEYGGDTMDQYVLFTDATADLPNDLFERMDIQVIPMDFEMGGTNYTHYPDGRELSSTEFFQRIQNGEMATTSQINVTRYYDFFTPFLKAGKDILYLSFSSGLSGTYQASVLACNELMEEYKERKIVSIDTLCASGGEGLLVYMAAQRKQAGMSMDELVTWVETNRLNICHWFTVDDLHHLKRGGRISAISATFGTALNIKPLLHVDTEGKLAVHSKIRGKKRCIEKLLECMTESAIEPDKNPVVITHSNCYEDAAILADKVKEIFHTSDITISDMSPIIGAHTGSGTLVLTFLGTQR